MSDVRPAIGDISSYMRIRATNASTRKKTQDCGEKYFEAQEVAQRILRLCYPHRVVSSVHASYNNEPIDPIFVEREGYSQRPIDGYTVIDFEFTFGDSHVGPIKNAFVVELTIPRGENLHAGQEVMRARWALLNRGERGLTYDACATSMPAGETLISFSTNS